MPFHVARRCPFIRLVAQLSWGSDLVVLEGAFWIVFPFPPRPFHLSSSANYSHDAPFLAHGGHRYSQPKTHNPQVRTFKSAAFRSKTSVYLWSLFPSPPSPHESCRECYAAPFHTSRVESLLLAYLTSGNSLCLVVLLSFLFRIGSRLFHRLLRVSREI